MKEPPVAHGTKAAIYLDGILGAYRVKLEVLDPSHPTFNWHWIVMRLIPAFASLFLATSVIAHPVSDVGPFEKRAVSAGIDLYVIYLILSFSRLNFSNSQAVFNDLVAYFRCKPLCPYTQS